MLKSIHVVTEDEKRKAKNFSSFRGEVKAYLASVGRNYDKFTVTENDSFLGYISELAIKEELKNLFGSDFRVLSWSDNFDMRRVYNIVKQNLVDNVSADYVKSYFYDQYDLQIVQQSTQKTLNIDVKTAETFKAPQITWDFLYPVVQNRKDGKDYIILCYYYKNSSGQDIILVGCLSEEEISKCHILKKGERTKFHTINQIDNYETNVRQYKDISFLKTLF